VDGLTPDRARLVGDTGLLSIKHAERSVQTLVVYPETKDKRPVVLVIHEIFGLSDWAQELADEVAAAGYIAVAPDLLSGMAQNGGRTKDFASGGVMEAVKTHAADLGFLGFDATRAAEVLAAGPVGIAVMGSIMRALDPGREVKALLAILAGTQPRPR